MNSPRGYFDYATAPLNMTGVVQVAPLNMTGELIHFRVYKTVKSGYNLWQMQSGNTTIYKGIAVFMAVAFLILGARFMDNGALNYARDGVGYYRYDELDNEYYQKQVPLFNSRGEYEKILLNGGRDRVERLLCDLNATTLKSEKINGLTVIYARSPYLSKTVALSFGKVNLMIAYDGEKVTVGTPLIKGSY